MIAKYSGRCNCGNRVKKGEEIEYNRAKKMITSCPRCEKEPGLDLAQRFDMAYEDQCSAACGLDSMQY